METTLTPEQALSLLDQATQPGAKLTRMDYAVIQQALMVLEQLVKEHGATSLQSPEQ